MSPGGIPTKAAAFVLLLALLLPLSVPEAAGLPDLVVQDVRFEVPGHDLIPRIAAFRASCDVTTSGEPLTLRDNETVRTTISAVPGPCAMVLVLFGYDVAVPTINTTPIGRSSYYIPGLSIATIGIVDVSLDLQASLNSTSNVADGAVATIDDENVDWASWGAQRLVVRGAHEYGSVATSAVDTMFHYGLSLGITIWIAGIQAYQTSLADFGRYAGTPPLATPLSVDLLPHPLVLGPAQDVTYEGATLNWTGTVDRDVEHMELWVAGGATNVSYRITDRVTSAMSVPLRADTEYRAWIVTVDDSGQQSVSAGVTFHTLTVPPAPEPTPTPAPVYTESRANVIVVATVVLIALLAVAVAYGFGRTRGRT